MSLISSLQNAIRSNAAARLDGPSSGQAPSDQADPGFPPRLDRIGDMKSARAKTEAVKMRILDVMSRPGGDHYAGRLAECDRVIAHIDERESAEATKAHTDAELAAATSNVELSRAVVDDLDGKLAAIKAQAEELQVQRESVLAEIGAAEVDSMPSGKLQDRFREIDQAATVKAATFSTLISRRTGPVADLTAAMERLTNAKAAADRATKMQHEQALRDAAQGAVSLIMATASSVSDQREILELINRQFREPVGFSK